eukprot:CAMPEP_0175974938 /NCGR_PEP_ID=MMETSP0108-20121206/43658_1 /TAXON_ID=195067 ORGANISM="Goniomonas pacifica, Strain CCMP1869" /NCGR_SAMPLE_ID=MMETSP0108 /ASSEMBLY_ACC=CAM_ASM_000204 /LENGTH=38 /DNA_ID= /DNA_START= /DNA_END= /DNA_ORIENTATION=
MDKSKRWQELVQGDFLVHQVRKGGTMHPARLRVCLGFL